ncbi:MAG: DUF4340 domain-containing protein [Limisphaerales bacterium]
MNSKTTGFWFVLAATLDAFIFFFQFYFHPPAAGVKKILPGLRTQSITSVQIIPVGAPEIRADRTNDSWTLSKPIIYPAQSAAIEGLLGALQKLTPATRISASELRKNHADSEFGFDPPQLSVVLESDDNRRELQIGNKTAPGDQVFVRVVGTDGAFVTDVGWLKLIPQAANDWRDTTLINVAANHFGAILLTNGGKGIVIELHQNPTNHLWRMTRPLQSRADSQRITDALQHLQAARVSQFVNDDPKADLSAYGLQPADLDLWLGHDTNFSAALHFGKSPTNDSTQIFAKRENWNAIVTTAADPLSPWRGSVNDFRDPHLLELIAPVAEIEMRGAGTNHFTLQRQGSNNWLVAGETFPVDAGSVQQFIKTLTDLRVAGFVKDVVTAADLQNYGLATPARQIILRSAAGDSNAVIAQLSFAVQTNGIFVYDRNFIYSITPEDFNRLPEAGLEFRERRIWNFDETNVAQITLRQNGKTRVMIHNGINRWSLAAGSQGIINPPAIEEIAHRFGKLTAAGWVARNLAAPEKLGFNTNNLQITIELKNGEKRTVDFGAPISNQTALATVTLDGERWTFVFPLVLYQYVVTYLTIPANGRG